VAKSVWAMLGVVVVVWVEVGGPLEALRLERKESTLLSVGCGGPRDAAMPGPAWGGDDILLLLPMAPGKPIAQQATNCLSS
jgi:hypothetical protein